VIRPALELAHFTVRDGEEETLIAERAEMLRALRRAFPAARAAWLTKQDDGSWLDVILWSSREAAEEAARRIDELPEARAWFRHIAESHGVRHVDVVHEEILESSTGEEPASGTTGSTGRSMDVEA
jgi:hypothetical protein